MHVLSPGTLNTGGGPDFLGASLRVDDQHWHGDVEIHVGSAQWYQHRHHLDPRYNSVVLHVILETDIWTGGLLRQDGEGIPEVVLAPRLETPLQTLLHSFHRQEKQALPCANHLPQVSPDVQKKWLTALAQERFQAPPLREQEAGFSHDRWLYRRVFKALGYAKNAMPMQSLAARIPLTLARTIEDPLDLEALYLGTADLIPAAADLVEADRDTADYCMALSERYQRMAPQITHPQMLRSQWTFARMRPANFPTLRLAQAVRLLAPGGLLRDDPLGRLVEAAKQDKPLAALAAWLDVEPRAFWKRHFRLEKRSRPHSARIGKARQQRIFANAILPLLSQVATETNDPTLAQALEACWTALPPEDDEIVRQYAGLPVRFAHAADTQALHLLNKTYCEPGRCLQCAFGQSMMQEEEAGD